MIPVSFYGLSTGFVLKITGIKAYIHHINIFLKKNARETFHAFAKVQIKRKKLSFVNRISRLCVKREGSYSKVKVDKKDKTSSEKSFV